MSFQREADFRNLTRKAPLHIGHPDLAPGARNECDECKKRGLIYVSIPEAIYLERDSGLAVEIHWEPTALDERLLGGLRTRARARLEKDRLADGWFARQFDTTAVAPSDDTTTTTTKEQSDNG